LRVTSGNKLGLVRAIFTLLATLCPFLALSFFLLGLALVLQTTQCLTNRCSFDTGLLIRRVIETSGGFFLERDVGVVLC
jgi:hypothetical protein